MPCERHRRPKLGPRSESRCDDKYSRSSTVRADALLTPLDRRAKYYPFQISKDRGATQSMRTSPIRFGQTTALKSVAATPYTAAK